MTLSRGARPNPKAILNSAHAAFTVSRQYRTIEVKKEVKTNMQPDNQNQEKAAPPEQPLDTTSADSPITHPPQPARIVQAAKLAPRSNTRAVKIAAAVIVIGAVTTLGFGGYLFFGERQAPVGDLVQATVQRTAYLRPRAWSQTSSPDGSKIYSDAEKGGSKVGSLVGVSEGETILQLAGASDSAYAQVRKELVAAASASTLEPYFEKSGAPCKDTIKFSATADTQKSATTTGLILTSGTCTRNDGLYTVKSRTVIGTDGRVRLIMLAAPEESWTKNQKMFQAMLDSLGVIDTNTQAS